MVCESRPPDNQADLIAKGMMASVPQFRIPPDSKRKFCAFLCGSECFVTPDPVDTERDSIRWGTDTKD